MILSAISTAAGTVCLVLATSGTAASRMLPLGILLCFAGLNAFAAVLLLGQRAVMNRTSAMLLDTRAVPPPEFWSSALHDEVQRGIDRAMPALAWSIDARLVGLLEHLQATHESPPSRPVEDAR